MVAERLGFLHLNTGAMYRAIALSARDAGLGGDAEPDSIHQLLERTDIGFADGGNVVLNGQDVSREILDPDIALFASELSTLPEVREKLVEKQRKIGSDGAVVLEGRDIGTVVFPDAELKIFLVADSSVRAERRQLELDLLGRHLELDELRNQLAERDKRDRERPLSPLKKAEDAIEVDTTKLTIEGQVQRVYELAMERMKHVPEGVR
jgi:cytidylate kinase